MRGPRVCMKAVLIFLGSNSLAVPVVVPKTEEFMSSSDHQGSATSRSWQCLGCDESRGGQTVRPGMITSSLAIYVPHVGSWTPHLEALKAQADSNRSPAVRSRILSTFIRH